MKAEHTLRIDLEFQCFGLAVQRYGVGLYAEGVSCFCGGYNLKILIGKVEKDIVGCFDPYSGAVTGHDGYADFGTARIECVFGE